MVTSAPRPWSVHDVPVLNDDGSNAEVWCLIVRAVASQHDASELLARDPHPGDVEEAASAHHLKAFLKATCCEKLKSSLEPLSPLQTWRFLKIAVTPTTRFETPVPPMSPISSFQEAGHLPSNGFSPLSPGLRTTGHYTMPDGYPARDAILIFTDDGKDFKSCTSEIALEEMRKLAEKKSGESKEKSEKQEESDAKEEDVLQEAETPEITKDRNGNGNEGLEKEKGQDTSGKTPNDEEGNEAPPTGEKAEIEVVPISTFRPFSGRRKALIIGINYADDSLSNCVRDAAYMAYLLLTKFNFVPSQIFMLTDDPHSVAGIRTGKPTRDGIDDGINWLMRDARAGDSLFFSFSGHGTRVVDFDGDEKDGWDEAICPLDYDGSCIPAITDDELYHKLVRRVPKGARLTAITDSCHSGSVLDLPYMYDSMTGERVPDPEPEQEAEVQLEPEKESRVSRILNRLRRRRNRRNSGSNDSQQSSEAPPLEFTIDPGIRYPTDRYSKGGEVVHISGCTDQQYSVEGSISTKGSGFLSHCFVEAIERGEYRDWKEYSYASLVRTIATKVQAWNHEQLPMFSTSHPFNLDTPFIL